MATTYDKASLVMIPSGYKDDKLYAVKPTDGSGDFTFSRDGAGASPATRVNASGLIEKGRTNELVQSNTFDTTWFLNGLPTLTGGQSGYDGSSDAWSLAGTGIQYASVRQTIALSEVVTLSVYAKAGTQDFLAMNTGGSLTAAWFNLSNGTLGSTDTNVIDSAIESIGGGWYRCSMSIVGISEFRIYVTDADNNFGTAIGNIYIQDAQLEQGLVATDYIETTTAPVSAGLLGDMPRLDYSGGATCPSLLLEPSRVNNLPYSEYFGASNWTKTNVAITDNATTSPEGVVNAAQITENASGLNLYGPSDTLVGSASAYTYSAFLKQGSLRYGGIRAIVNGFANRFFVNVDLQEGTITDTDTTGTGVTWSYDIENYGNGWHRVWISATNTSGNIDLAIGLSNSATPTYASGLPYYTGTGSDYIYAYGAQIEAGSYVSSYIPTYGSASTRGKDVCIDAGNSSTFNDSEGVLYAEISALANDLSNRLISLTNGTSTERISLFYSQDSSNEVKGIVFAGGVVTGEVEYNVPDITANIKVALKYKANDFALWINGVEVATDLSGAVPSGLDRLNFDLGISGSILPFFGNVKQTIYFPTALTDAELAALTA